MDSSASAGPKDARASSAPRVLYATALLLDSTRAGKTRKRTGMDESSRED
jgi:hypothetical protein